MSDRSPLRVSTYTGSSQWDAHQPGKSFASIFLFTGRGETPRTYRRLGARLAYDNFTTHAFDWDASQDDRELDDVAAQIDELHAASGAGTLVLLGSDVGATVALALAATHRVTPTALIVGGFTTRQLAEPVDWEAEIGLRSGCGAYRQNVEADPDFSRGRLHESSVPDALTKAVIPERIGAPVLVLRGERDVLAGHAETAEFVARLPRGSLSTLRDGGHDVFNERHSRSISAHIVQFIEQVRGDDPNRPLIVTEPLHARDVLHPAA